MHRVQKLLSNYGYCSRRKAEDLIKQGRVMVNNKIITIGDSADFKDKISVDGKIVRKPRKVYLMFHKPPHCVTALTDPRYKTVMDYVKISERVFPVGRLDFNTQGLLILTNDGDFANSIMHPRYEIQKTYLAGIDRHIIQKDLAQLQKGVKLTDGVTIPKKVRKVTPDLIEITIHEGKNRIIRRMLEELGYNVRFLKRIKVGNLLLGDIKPGTFRTLKRKDREKIFMK